MLIGQHMANLRRTGEKNGLGKDPERATARAARLTAIDPDWNCPWPLDWQRHYKVLADLFDTDGVLPDIPPGVPFEGDDIGRWLTRQKQPGTWAQLSAEQQERLTALGIEPPQTPPPAPRRQQGPGKARSKAQAAFQRGLTALTQWVEREPRSTVVEIEVDDETEPVPVKLGVWVSDTKTRRDKLTQEQRAALAKLGVEWAV